MKKLLAKAWDTFTMINLGLGLFSLGVWWLAWPALLLTIFWPDLGYFFQGDSFVPFEFSLTESLVTIAISGLFTCNIIYIIRHA